MAFFKKSKDQPPPRQPAPAQAASASAAARAAGSVRAPAASSAKINGAAAPAAPPDLEALKAGVERSRRTLIALGEIVSVMMKSPEYRGATLATVQGLVAPAISSGQYLVLTAHQKQGGSAVPVAVAMWASVSEEVDRRLSQASDGLSLSAADWTSGKIAWITALAGDQRTIPALLGRMQQTTLKGRVIKLRTKGEDGKTEVRTLPQPGPMNQRTKGERVKA